MELLKMRIENIPIIIWGKQSDNIYLYVHEKVVNRETLEEFAILAEEKGYQTLSYDYTQCEEYNNIYNLSVIGKFAFDNWKEVSLFMEWIQR